MSILAPVVGILLALTVGALATAFGMDRDRAFYPTVTIVVASYYVLFAVMGASPQVLVVESIVGVLFLALAVAGFRSSLWLVVIALAAHGVFDLVHGHVIVNSGLPLWWPPFCLAYDLTSAAYLAWLIKVRRNAS
jgi:hypothetical protein